MITQKELKERLTYNPETGIFTWNKTELNRRNGLYNEAGALYKVINSSTNLQYIQLMINGENYRAHRLAFLYMTGNIPEFIDHIDLNGLNNKWSNLRISTKSLNSCNTKRRKDNKVGIKGVSFDGLQNRYISQISLNGKLYNARFRLAAYPSPELALQAATNWIQNKRLELHGTFANHG